MRKALKTSLRWCSRIDEELYQVEEFDQRCDDLLYFHQFTLGKHPIVVEDEPMEKDHIDSKQRDNYEKSRKKHHEFVDQTMLTYHNVEIEVPSAKKAKHYEKGYKIGQEFANLLMTRDEIFHLV